MSNPFSFAVPSSFQNQATICLSTANIGINFQSTKFFRENFLPDRAFSKIPFTFHPPYRLSSSFSSSLPLLSCPLPCLPSPYARTRMHTHVRPYAHMMRALAYARTRTRVIYHPISYTPIIQQKKEKKIFFHRYICGQS